MMFPNRIWRLLRRSFLRSECDSVSRGDAVERGRGVTPDAFYEPAGFSFLSFSLLKFPIPFKLTFADRLTDLATCVLVPTSHLRRSAFGPQDSLQMGFVERRKRFDEYDSLI